jgi:LemA protein
MTPVFQRWAALLLLITTLSLSACGYNQFQSGSEQVKASWAEVLSQYQRRADLIPNLVNVVKGQADFESSTLQAVVDARAKATAIQATPELVNDGPKRAVGLPVAAFGGR